MCYGDIVFTDILPETGYNPVYYKWQWFSRCKREGQAIWSEPYLDDGGANVPVITYSVPIRQDGVFVGVATMDVMLNPNSSLDMSAAPPFEPDDAETGAALGCGVVVRQHGQ